MSPRALEAFEDELSRTDPAFLAALSLRAVPRAASPRSRRSVRYERGPLGRRSRCRPLHPLRRGARRVGVLAVSRSPQRSLAESPRREELCPVPIGDIRAWTGKVFVFDYLDGEWYERDVKRIVPGMTVLLASRDGGYTLERGWSGKGKPSHRYRLVSDASNGALAPPSAIEDADDLSVAAGRPSPRTGARPRRRRGCCVNGWPSTRRWCRCHPRGALARHREDAPGVPGCHQGNRARLGDPRCAS